MTCARTESSNSEAQDSVVVSPFWLHMLLDVTLSYAVLIWLPIQAEGMKSFCQPLIISTFTFHIMVPLVTIVSPAVSEKLAPVGIFGKSHWIPYDYQESLGSCNGHIEALGALEETKEKFVMESGITIGAPHSGDQHHTPLLTLELLNRTHLEEKEDGHCQVNMETGNSQVPGSKEAWINRPWKNCLFLGTVPRILQWVLCRACHGHCYYFQGSLI